KQQKQPRRPAPSTDDDRLARAKKHVRKDVSKTDMEDTIVLDPAHPLGKGADLSALNVSFYDALGFITLEDSGLLSFRMSSAPKRVFLVHCTVALATKLSVAVHTNRDNGFDLFDGDFTVEPGSNSIDFVLQPQGEYQVTVGITSSTSGWEFSGCEITPV